MNLTQCISTLITKYQCFRKTPFMRFKIKVTQLKNEKTINEKKNKTSLYCFSFSNYVILFN